MNDHLQKLNHQSTSIKLCSIFGRVTKDITCPLTIKHLKKLVLEKVKIKYNINKTNVKIQFN